MNIFKVKTKSTKSEHKDLLKEKKLKKLEEKMRLNLKKRKQIKKKISNG